MNEFFWMGFAGGMVGFGAMRIIELIFYRWVMSQIKCPCELCVAERGG